MIYKAQQHFQNFIKFYIKWRKEILEMVNYTVLAITTGVVVTFAPGRAVRVM